MTARRLDLLFLLEVEQQVEHQSLDHLVEGGSEALLGYEAGWPLGIAMVLWIACR